MKIFTRLLTLSSLTVALFCCVNDDYDIKDISDINTDISFGGAEFGIPIGSLSPVSLSSLIKETNLIRLVNGQYELQNQSLQSVTVPYINPITIAPTIPTIASANVDFAGVDIKDIKVLKVVINANETTTISQTQAGLDIDQKVIVSQTKNIEIGYSYSKELKQINWVEFGAGTSGAGDLMELTITPSYDASISNASTVINSFSITFPYGFELGLHATNTYGATLSNSNKTLAVTSKTLIAGTPIQFYVKKVTFNPSIDQKTPGNLDYEGAVVCQADFNVKGKTTGTPGYVDIAFSTEKQLTIADGQFNTNNISEQVDITSTISIDEPVSSSEIKSISKISIAKNCKIHLSSTVSGLPSWVQTINLSNYTIQFPKFLVFKAGQGITPDNKIVINEPISTATGLAKSYEIEGFVFDQNKNPIKNGRIQVSDDIVITGEFTIPQADKINNTDINGIKQIKLQPKIALDQIKIETVTGIIDPKIEIAPINIEVELGSDMSFIENSTLDLTKTAIQIEATNPVGITAEIGLTINTYDQLGTKITQITQPSGIVIQPGASSNIWLSNSKENMPEGFIYVENKELPTIFRRMPNRLEVLLTANTEKYESVINMASQSRDPMVFVCNIIAPLTVGSEFELAYSDRIKDLHSTIGDYLQYASELVLNLSTSSNIPLNLKLSAKPFDKNGAELKGISITIDGVVGAGTKEGAFTNSTVALTLKETTKGEMQKLDQIELSFKGNASQALAGAPLRADQTINVKMSAKIPGGVNIK